MMFTPNSFLKRWLRSNEVTPRAVEHYEREAEELEQKARQHRERAELARKETNERQEKELAAKIKADMLPYSMQLADDLEKAFIANVLRETHLYPDNNGPDAFGLTHREIEIDFIYRVTLSDANCRYLTYLSNNAKPIAFPKALTQNPYLGKPNNYPVLVRHYITPHILHELKLETDKEVLLFHGTKQEYLDSILRTGLQADKSAAGLYGKGIYLTDSSQKADRYADFRNKTRLTSGLTMLVVRAALGDLQVYRRDMPMSDKAVVGGFGLDGGTRFREFIVKEDNQCCIEYVVHYHRVY